LPGAGIVESTRPVFDRSSGCDLGDLKQVLAVEGGSCVATSIERTVFPLAGSRAFSLSPTQTRRSAVKRNAIHAVGTREGAIFTNDFGCRCFMLSPRRLDASNLITRQRAGEQQGCRESHRRRHPAACTRVTERLHLACFRKLFERALHGARAAPSAIASAELDHDSLSARRRAPRHAARR
jgi:hypothetical protein